MSHPPGDTPRYCNACNNDVTGFVYHCKTCGFDLHPCCAKLPMVLDDGEIKLYLYMKVGSPCHRCGRKGRSWSYRSACKNYNLHVACVREMLVENWHEIYIGNGRGKGGRKLETSIPSLKNTLVTAHNNRRRGSRGKKVKKCCEIAGLAVQFVISAVLGDPTALIAGIVGSLMSRAWLMCRAQNMYGYVCNVGEIMEQNFTVAVFLLIVKLKLVNFHWVFLNYNWYLSCFILNSLFGLAFLQRK